MLTFALLAFCAGAIYVACEYFVNAIEWLGCRLNMGATATGTVLAALGTALPESAVTLMAVAYHSDAAKKDIGIGAALGGPLVLATVSYAVVGLMIILCAKKLGRADTTLHLNQKRLSDDQLCFVAIFIFKLALGLVAFHYKPWTGILFLGAYALYIRKEMRYVDNICEVVEPLKLTPSVTAPKLSWILVQTLGSLAVIALASHGFVGALEKAAPLLGISPQLTALLFSPLATELPETMNAIIWLRQGKEKLALANISGAMMIQATIPSAIGLFFTPWLFDASLMLAGGITLAATLILGIRFRRGAVTGRGLAAIGLLYLAFLGGVLILTHG